MNNNLNDDNMKQEYDFSGKQPIAKKYYQRLRKGYSIHIHHPDNTTSVQTIIRPEGTVTLDADVRLYFPDDESVNNALRGLIRLIPNKEKTM